MPNNFGGDQCDPDYNPNYDKQILLIVYKRGGADSVVLLPNPDDDGVPTPARWWPKGAVTACIDHEENDAHPDLVGWIAGADKHNTDNLFSEVYLQSVLKMWCMQFGAADQWRFEIYNPETKGGCEVKLTPKPKRRRR